MAPPRESRQQLSAGARRTCHPPSPLAQSTTGHLEEVIDRGHKRGQVALVDAALGEPCGELFQEFDPPVHVARRGTNGHLNGLLNDPGADRVSDDVCVRVLGTARVADPWSVGGLRIRTR